MPLVTPPLRRRRPARVGAPAAGARAAAAARAGAADVGAVRAAVRRGLTPPRRAGRRAHRIAQALRHPPHRQVAPAGRAGAVLRAVRSWMNPLDAVTVVTETDLMPKGRSLRKLSLATRRHYADTIVDASDE